MNESYATTQDVLDRWIASSLPPEKAVLEKYLREASLIIDSEFPHLRAFSENDETLLEKLRIVSSRMVIRAVLNPDRLRQVQDTTGPFSGSFTLATETLGDMRLTADDKAILLGGANRRGKAFTVDTTPRSTPNLHSEVCNLRFGASYCSCGSDINGGAGPIFGGDSL